MDLKGQTWFFGDRAASEQTLRRLGVDAMTGTEFESFVADLMETTGFEVDRVGGPGDLGADLVARSKPVSMTVQIKRYGPEGSVSRRAISDAIAAREHYGVNSAAVVTNQTFTGDAREFARGRCLLVDRGFLGAWAATHEDDLVQDWGAAPFDGMTGTEFEAFLAELLRDQGFEVQEIGGSGDFGVDLIARSVERSIAVQAKRRSSPVSRRAVSDAVAGKGYHDCDGAWVVTSAPRFTSGAQTLANSTGARLVDGDELMEWAEHANVELPTDRASDRSLKTPEDLVGRLRWADQLSEANFSQPTLNLKSGWLITGLAALFLRRIKGEMKLSYSGVPIGTWLGINFPPHSLLTWEAIHEDAQSLQTAIVVPLSEGSGRVRIQMTARLPRDRGVKAGLQTIQRAVSVVGSKQMQIFFWSDPPGREQLLELVEAAGEA